ncbi:CbrC family protein [Bacillus safensis]|uniref:CbrC family protein n=1 Tax=Bacillus safensis TaxID=561879 RepID=UPI0036711E6E
MTLPTFKYNPDPVSLNVIKKEHTTCPVCEKERDYVYHGPFYAVENVDGICPWCIKDGSAAKKYDGTFQDDASCDDVDHEEYIDELIFRTPGYRGWQQEYWLSHCGDFCAIVQYVGWKEIEHLEEELAEDIEDICSGEGLTKENLKQWLVNGGDLQGYLFQCVHCNKHRLYIDAS